MKEQLKRELNVTGKGWGELQKYSALGLLPIELFLKRQEDKEECLYKQVLKKSHADLKRGFFLQEDEYQIRSF